MEFIDNWYKQARAIVTQPKEFFKKMPTSGGFGEPYWFAVVNMLISFILSAGFTFASMDAEFEMALQYLGINVPIFMLIMVPVVFVLGSIGLFLSSGIYHLFLKLVGAKKNYEATFRVLAYLSVFNVFTSVSSLNSQIIDLVVFVFVLYVLYIMIYALKEVHEISFLRSAIAVLLPVVVISIMIVIVVILMAVVFMGGVMPPVDFAGV